MPPAPPSWRLALARLDGALAYVDAPVHAVLAQRSLRRLWAVHVRNYSFDNTGPDHDPGLEAGELMRSWYAQERGPFLSWISRHAPPALAQAATQALHAKGLAESWTTAYADAGRALARLDALLPSPDPLATLLQLVGALRRDELAFLEADSEIVAVAGHAWQRAAPRGAAWAASLAVALRPQLFALGAAQLALAGLLPRELFRPEPEREAEIILAEAIAAAAAQVCADLAAAHRGLALGRERLAGRSAASRARDAWALLLGLGPLTRAELARALGVTARTASQAVIALEQAELVALRPGDGAILVLKGELIDAI